jgi:hypothetical protein
MCADFGKNATAPADWCTNNSVWAYPSRKYLTTLDCGYPYFCPSNPGYPCYSYAAHGPYYQIISKVNEPHSKYTGMCEAVLYGACAKTQKVTVKTPIEPHTELGELGQLMGVLPSEETYTTTAGFCLPVYYYFTNSSVEYFSIGDSEVDKSELDFSGKFTSGGSGVINIIGA